MKKSAIFIFLIVLSTKLNAVADDVPENPVVLSLQEFIKETCAHDVAFQKILSDNLKLAYLKDLNLQSKDIILSVTSQYNFYIQDSENNGLSGSASLSKLFPAAGAETSLSYSTRPNVMGNRASAFTAQISQPVAQNAFGSINRLVEEMLEIDIDVARYQVTEAYEDYLASVIALYYEWYTNYANLKTASASLEENSKLLNNIKEKKKFSIASQSDVDKISLQLIEKRENQYSLENAYNKSLDLIYQASGITNKNVIPGFSPYTDRDIDFDMEYAEFIRSGRTYEILNLIDKKGAIDVKAKAGALLPSVDLLFGYSREGNGYTLKEPDDSLYLGFALQFPVRRSRAKVAYEISKIEKDKTAFNSENTKRKLETNLKSVYNQIRLEEKYILSAEEKISIGERILKSETNNYQQARAGLSDLIKAINDLENLKYNKSYHLTKLNMLRIEWLRLTDKLIFKDNVKLN